jgi:hypothetical protein
MVAPRDLVERIESAPTLPGGTEERFSGYGVMGVPFRSGHVLALRRFPASSIGSGYTSLWHRAPSGDWVFYQDVAPEKACSRYFGPALRKAIQRPIEVQWTESARFTVRVDGGKTIDWDVWLSASAATRAMNTVARLVPDVLWRRPGMLRAMGFGARHVLGTGQIALTGRLPSGQRFAANPLAAWVVHSSRARVEGVDVGPPGPLPEQARLGDFWIPQRGLFVVGRAFMEPLDASRHRLAVPVAT